MLTTAVSQDGYMRIFDYERNAVWDATNGQMDAIGSVSVADSKINVPFNTVHRVGTITLPSGLPKNLRYVIHIYDVALADAADADDPDGTILVINKTTRPEFYQSVNYPLVPR